MGYWIDPKLLCFPLNLRQSILISLLKNLGQKLVAK